MAFNGLSGEEVKSKGLGWHPDKAPVTLPMSQCTGEDNSFCVCVCVWGILSNYQAENYLNRCGISCNACHCGEFIRRNIWLKMNTFLNNVQIR